MSENGSNIIGFIPPLLSAGAAITSYLAYRDGSQALDASTKITDADAKTNVQKEVNQMRTKTIYSGVISGISAVAGFFDVYANHTSKINFLDYGKNSSCKTTNQSTTCPPQSDINY